jgi:hypothetical protein
MSSEYVKQRLAAILKDGERSSIKSRPIRKLRASEAHDALYLDQIVSENTGPDGEIYGYRD